MRSKVMNADLSVYLDLLRLIAALAVFLHHANILYFHREHTFFLSKGRQAVAVFFVLSGFVISFVVAEKERDWKTYTRARIARLYSVTIVSITVALLADAIGFHFNRPFYEALPFYYPPTMATLLKYLSFTNQVWFTHAVLGTNEPFWSLGFEASYYVLFGFLTYARKSIALLMVLVWVAGFGPNIALFFPLWFLGDLVYRAMAGREVAISRRAAWLLFGGSIVFLLLVDRMGARVTGNMYYFYKGVQELLLVIFFYLIGIAVSLNLLSFRLVAQGQAVFSAKFAAVIRWLAGASFTLYLTHLPLLTLMLSLQPKIRTSSALGVVACLLVLLMVLMIAEVGERRKHLFSLALKRISA